MCDMVADEGAHKVVAVVVAFLHAQLEFGARLFGGGFEGVGVQLGLEESVLCTLVHQNRQLAAFGFEEQGGVVGFPGAAVLAEVVGEGFVAPGDVGGGRFCICREHVGGQRSE